VQPSACQQEHDEGRLNPRDARPQGRVCPDEPVRILVKDLLDWRDVPVIAEGGKTHRVTYESMWIHASDTTTSPRQRPSGEP
jgi:hypothetical protein